MLRAHITAELVREFLDYDPTTGKFKWKNRRRKWFQKDEAWLWWNYRWANEPALTADCGQGYVGGRICGIRCKAHRVAWLYVHGKWPDDLIDHKNRIRTDNRINNLRIVTPLENARNHSIARNNTSGYVGVTWLKHRNKWWARIKMNKKYINLGVYSEKEDAVKARKDAEWALNFDPNNV